MKKVQRALISVSDKNGILPLAQQLCELGIEILSTGGTHKYLKQHDIPTIEVASVTNFPEILDGRVKTLHPKIHGGILAQRNNIEHMQQLEQHAIIPIDLVCINLYPFEQVVNTADCTLNTAIENIDIGGPAMIRASSKNYQDVIILTNPKDYPNVIEQLRINHNVSLETRLALAYAGFNHTAYYDSLISQYLSQYCPQTFPHQLTISGSLNQVLRYGENAHQHAAFYKDSGDITGLLASFIQLQGKELSFNNLVDADTAWECVKQFMWHTCVIVKHANPCGVASSTTVLLAYQLAKSSDPISSFGGIIAFNTQIDTETATALAEQFCEVIIAPAYTVEALAILAKKTNVRLLQIKLGSAKHNFDYKKIGGGLLVQTPEHQLVDITQVQVVSKCKPDKTLLADLEYAWKIARFVKSNAIVLVKNRQTIGIGAGQMSRIDSTKIAISKARDFGFDLAGSVAASDAFFPFRDNIDLLATANVTGVIHPGGSMNDAEVLSAIDKHKMIMLLTGYRIFRH